MEVLVENLTFLTWQQVLMWLIGGVLIYLAIVKEMEPSLLLPMGFGAILVNLPNSGAAEVIAHLFELGIAGHELFPLLLFIGIGAMIDFQPLLANPKLMIFGAAAQFGIFFTLGLASLLGFELNDAASIAIIGAADGPTSIFVAQQLGSSYTAAIMVAANSYMALVPMVQPPVIRLCTTQAERKIKMTYKGRPVSKTTKILFPIAVTVIVGLVAPQAVALIGFLMFGNLIRECGVLNSLSETAQNVLANLITILLGLTIASRMNAAEFLRVETLLKKLGLPTHIQIAEADCQMINDHAYLRNSVALAEQVTTIGKNALLNKLGSLTSTAKQREVEQAIAVFFNMGTADTITKKEARMW